MPTYNNLVPKLGGQALVIGGSMAGLLSARVLADRFERVRIVERDAFPGGPEFRKGVPQSRHIHVFLERGRRIVERLFPGIEEDLVSSGAEVVDLAQYARWLTPAGLAPRFRSGLSLLACSRTLLEWAVRERLASLPNVHFQERTDVTNLLPGPGDARIAGVRVRFRGPRGGEAGDQEEIWADLVVDASGRNSDASNWLRGLGYVLPDETVINARPGYATRVYERPEGTARDWKVMFLQAAPPEHPRGGLIFPVENGRWMCGLIGMGGDHPPTDEEGFLRFACSLRSPMIYEAIRDANPVSSVFGYREIENRHRHYEKLSRQPDNFLVTGDAACAFNPVYGQGMTTAALGAEALEECLRERRNGDLDGLSRRFHKNLAKVNDAPWLLATGEDFRVRSVKGGEAGFSTRLTHRYMDRVLELSMQDIEVRRTFLEVFVMTKPPTALFAPAIAAKVLRQAVARNKAGSGEAATPEHIAHEAPQ